MESRASFLSIPDNAPVKMESATGAGASACVWAAISRERSRMLVNVSRISARPLLGAGRVDVGGVDVLAGAEVDVEDVDVDVRPISSVSTARGSSARRREVDAKVRRHVRVTFSTLRIEGGIVCDVNGDQLQMFVMHEIDASNGASTNW